MLKAVWSRKYAYDTILGKISIRARDTVRVSYATCNFLEVVPLSRVTCDLWVTTSAS